MATNRQKLVLTPLQKVILQHNRNLGIEKQRRIQKFKQTISEEDKRLLKLFHWSQFTKAEPVSLKDIVFGEKYMYLAGMGEICGIVRAFPSEDEYDYGLCVEFIENGEQDIIIFTEETEKKLYKLPLLPRILRESIKPFIIN